MTRRKARRQTEGRDKELATNKNGQSYVQLVGQGRHNQHKETRRVRKTYTKKKSTESGGKKEKRKKGKIGKIIAKGHTKITIK